MQLRIYSLNIKIRPSAKYIGLSVEFIGNPIQIQSIWTIIIYN